MVFIFFLLPIIFCDNYKELPKYGSIEVYPYTRVYLNISSFKTGEIIYFEITVNSLNSNYFEKNKYSFQIEQVSTSSYSDYYWDNLNKVTSTNVKNEILYDYIFKWEEKKLEGKTYIFIITPEPFYSLFNRDYKIKIKNTKGNSLDITEIIVEIIASLVLLIIVIIIIICCCKCKGSTNQYIQNIPQQRSLQIYKSRNTSDPEINDFHTIQPNPPVQPQIIINQTNIIRQNNIQVKVLKKNQNGRQSGRQMNNRQTNTLKHNSSQQNSLRIDQTNKQQPNPQLENIQENYAKQIDIQNKDPQFLKPIDEDKKISFNNSKHYDFYIDSNSKITNNDNQNDAPSLSENLD